MVESGRETDTNVVDEATRRGQLRPAGRDPRVHRGHGFIVVAQVLPAIPLPTLLLVLCVVLTIWIIKRPRQL
jgi:hypothetical protein